MTIFSGQLSTFIHRIPITKMRPKFVIIIKYSTFSLKILHYGIIMIIFKECILSKLNNVNPDMFLTGFMRYFYRLLSYISL